MTKITKAIRFPNGETYVYDPYWDKEIESGLAELITGKSAAEAVHAFRRSRLLEIIKPKTTLRVVCTHSRGLTSHFRVFVPVLLDGGSPHIRDITKEVAELAGFRRSKCGDIVMGGYGYSKSFQIGYALGCALWPDGTPEPHGMRNGQPDSAGGYAIGVN